MRVKVLLKFCALTFMYLLVHMYLPGCAKSSEENAEEEIEATNENANADVSNVEDSSSSKDELSNAPNSESTQENFEANSEASDIAQDSTPTNTAESAGSEITQDLQSNTTNQDLQNIVSQQGGETTQPPVEEVMPETPTTQTAQTTSTTQPTTVPVSTGAALPELGSKMPYIVQAGDTISKIAMKIYGDPNRWQDIASLSSLANPNKIYPGDVVYYQLTPETLAFATKYESLPKIEIVATKGDTLSKLAEQKTGSWANWKILWRHSDGIENPDKIDVGQVIYCLDISTMSAAINNTESQTNKSFAQQFNNEIHSTNNKTNNTNFFNNIFDFIIGNNLYS